jgi:hypothetical protein
VTTACESRAGGVVDAPETSATEPDPPEEPPRTLTSTTRATTSGTSTAPVISAIRRSGSSSRRRGRSDGSGGFALVGCSREELRC